MATPDSGDQVLGSLSIARALSECPGRASEASARVARFALVLQGAKVDLSALRELAWNGVPSCLRPVVWALLFEYMPTSALRRVATLVKKRREYCASLRELTTHAYTPFEESIVNQIRKDLPRTCQQFALFRSTAVQTALEHVLFTWSVRHPASGYVQGMNDLAAMLFLVFVTPLITRHAAFRSRLRPVDVDADELGLGAEQLAEAEADTYWAFRFVLSKVHENFTADLPGIYRNLALMNRLLNRVDADYAAALTNSGVSLVVVAFRWMATFLIREVPLEAAVRLWDTYAAEASFHRFHIYVCVAFLMHFRETLLAMDTEQVMLFVQQLPTDDWGAASVAELVSAAFVLRSQFELD